MARAKDTGAGEARNVCGHRRKDGGMCIRSAGKGTEHKGSGRCFEHDYERREAGMGDAKILAIIARNPELEARAQVYLNSDRELLNARRELSTLKARFEMMHVNDTDESDSDVPRLCQLANTISLMTRRIQDIEIARKHYIHINTLTEFIADFSAIGQRFVLEDQIEQFLDALEGRIKDRIPRSNARGIASRMMVRDARDVVVDVKDYEVVEEGKGEEIDVSRSTD